jgi:outer membrane protein TolC
MRIRIWALPMLLLLIAGCASQPKPEQQYADTAYKVQLAAANIETAAPATLPVEEHLTGAHPVEFYVQIALERNPEILAAQRTVAAEAQTIPQVTALEDPMLTDTFWPITQHSPQTASGRMPNSLMLSQKFPWLSKLRVRGEVAEQETKIALTQLAQAELNVTEQVYLAYYDIYYYQRAIGITLENEALLRDLVQFAEIRFRTGGSQQDVLRAQLELDRLRDQLIGLRRQLRIAQADLAALLHASQDLELQAVERLDLPPAPEVIEGLYELAVRCRPELHERMHAIVRDERRRELAALEYYPDVTLGVGWDYMTTDDALSPVADGKDNIGFTVGVNVPIWRDRIRAGVREAEQRAVASARRYDAARDDTFRQIRRFIAQADAFEQQIALYRDKIIPRAEQTLQVSLADYRVGKVDFLQVIDNYTELLAFEIQLVRLQTNLGQTLASLERVVGCQLAEGPAISWEATPAPLPDMLPAPAGAPPAADSPAFPRNQE